MYREEITIIKVEEDHIAFYYQYHKHMVGFGFTKVEMKIRLTEFE